MHYIINRISISVLLSLLSEEGINVKSVCSYKYENPANFGVGDKCLTADVFTRLSLYGFVLGHIVGKE